MTKDRLSFLFLLGVVASGCAHGKPAAPRAAATPPPPAVVDTIGQIISKADAHLAAGLEQSEVGHLKMARQEFDRALDGYLTAPGGALSDPRLAEAYRRTLEAIQLHELETLAAGDGFGEAPPEPAAIDDVADLTVGGAPASEDARRKAEDALRSETTDLEIVLNDEVLAAIDLYTGELREWFTAALGRGGRYLPRIREVFASEGLPQDLAYVALVESAFKTGALSRAKAKGLWQFIPATGRRFGLQQDWWVDERSNPEKATRAAAEYLRVLHDLFRDWNLALAAYNAGEGRVMRAIDRHGTANFWTLARLSALARETRNYVPMIHAAIVVAKAPQQYGIDIAREPEVRFDTVDVQGAVDLRLVAECAGSPLGDLQQLNPELRRLATPAARSYSVKVPAGTQASTQECLESTPAEKRVAFRTHVVGRGQSFSSLARQYGTSAREIAEANGLSTRRRLARGTQLIIPVRMSSSQRVARAAGRGSAGEAAGRPLASASPLDGGQKIRYRVRAGDTLYGIASRFHTTVDKLRQWNRGVSSRITPGQPLTLYTSALD